MKRKITVQGWDSQMPVLVSISLSNMVLYMEML